MFAPDSMAVEALVQFQPKTELLAEKARRGVVPSYRLKVSPAATNARCMGYFPDPIECLMDSVLKAPQRFAGSLHRIIQTQIKGRQISPAYRTYAYQFSGDQMQFENLYHPVCRASQDYPKFLVAQSSLLRS